MIFQCDWRWADSTSATWNASIEIGYFCNAKGQRGFKSTLAFLASHEACRRTAVFPIQLTRSHTRPASREACCRAAVKPRQSSCHPTPLRAYGAQSGVQGYYPWWLRFGPRRRSPGATGKGKRSLRRVPATLAVWTVSPVSARTMEPTVKGWLPVGVRTSSSSPT